MAWQFLIEVSHMKIDRNRFISSALVSYVWTSVNTDMVVIKGTAKRSEHA
jgi:hypothetical protein